MQSRFNFNAFQLTTCNNFEYAQSWSFNPKQVGPTNVDELCMLQENPLYQKSQINLTNCYEISFENNFMSEHGLVFKRELQNYMESVRIYLQKSDDSLLKRFPEGLYDLNTKMTCEELMMMTDSDMNEESKSKLIVDLKVYDKLMDFLNIVVDSCPSEIAMELVHVSQQILEEFLNSEHKENAFVEVSTLLELSSSKIRDLQGIKMLDLSITKAKTSPELKELNKKFQKFLEVYCATTILVIAQYFENPFNEESDCSGFKRSLDPFSLEEDEEDERVVTQPQKKRKFSF